MTTLQIKEMQYFSTMCFLANGWKCVEMQFVAFLERFEESQFYDSTADGPHASESGLSRAAESLSKADALSSHLHLFPNDLSSWAKV